MPPPAPSNRHHQSHPSHPSPWQVLNCKSMRSEASCVALAILLGVLEKTWTASRLPNRCRFPSWLGLLLCGAFNSYNHLCSFRQSAHWRGPPRKSGPGSLFFYLRSWERRKPPLAPGPIGVHVVLPRRSFVSQPRVHQNTASRLPTRMPGYFPPLSFVPATSCCNKMNRRAAGSNPALPPEEMRAAQAFFLRPHNAYCIMACPSGLFKRRSG